MQFSKFGLTLCMFVLATVAYADRRVDVLSSSSVPDIAEKVVRGVVNISTTQKIDDRFKNDPILRWFQGRGGFSGPTPNSLGSGVLVSADGLILTNNHVIDGAEIITVNFNDGQELSAKLVGQDPKSDIAVLKLETLPENVRPIELGDSDALRLGETVLAVGNPFGLGHTVTMGIVSATGRANLDITDYENFIQTDAAINPGNSGGALVNGRGELVGINTAIYSRSGGYQGIGFAIPSNMAAQIMDSLVNKGRVDRGYLGVGIQGMDAKLARRFGLSKKARGVLVNYVGTRSPAADAGIEAGDIIFKVDDTETLSPDILRNTVAMKGAGTEVRLKYWRDGKRKTAKVTLGLLPDGRQSQKTPNREKVQTDTIEEFGMSVVDLDDGLRRRLGIESDVKGVLVNRVSPMTRAARSGLRRGDVIVKVNRRNIDRVGVLESEIKKQADEVLLHIRRGDARLFVVL